MGIRMERDNAMQDMNVTTTWKEDFEAGKRDLVSSAVSMISAGKHFKDAKEKHQRQYGGVGWLTVLADNDLTIDTVNSAIQVYSTFGENVRNVPNISGSVLALLAKPSVQEKVPEVAQEVVQRSQDGETFTVAQVKKMIAEAKAEVEKDSSDSSAAKQIKPFTKEEVKILAAAGFGKTEANVVQGAVSLLGDGDRDNFFAALLAGSERAKRKLLDAIREKEEKDAKDRIERWNNMVAAYEEIQRDLQDKLNKATKKGEREKLEKEINDKRDEWEKEQEKWEEEKEQHDFEEQVSTRRTVEEHMLSDIINAQHNLRMAMGSFLVALKPLLEHVTLSENGSVRIDEVQDFLRVSIQELEDIRQMASSGVDADRNAVGNIGYIDERKTVEAR